jgi:hypothetical protein
MKAVKEGTNFEPAATKYLGPECPALRLLGMMTNRVARLLGTAGHESHRPTLLGIKANQRFQPEVTKNEGCKQWQVLNLRLLGTVGPESFALQLLGIVGPKFFALLFTGNYGWWHPGT